MARELKRNKTKLEKLIRKVWRETQGGKLIENDGQKRVVDAIQKTLEYFEIYDFLHNGDYKTIFLKVYLSTSRCITQQQASNMLHYSKNTIGNYCMQFILVFDKYYCGAKSQNTCDFASR